MQFQLFDSVKLVTPLTLSEGGIAPVGTPGAIVEVLAPEAYLVELFGNWVKQSAQGEFITAIAEDPEAFMETIGVELVNANQMALVESARQTLGTRGHLTAVLEDLPDSLVAEVCDFAEFLRDKQKKSFSRIHENA